MEGSPDEFASADLGVPPGPWGSPVKLLGSGTYGQVVEVVTPTGVHLAAKFAKTIFGALEDLALECRLLQKFQHPSVVSCFGLASEMDKVCLLLELGTTNLWNWLSKQTEMNVKARWKLVAQVSNALAFVHEQGVLHCDVKPANIIVFGSGNEENSMAKLGDFGMAKHMGSKGQVKVHPQSVYSWSYRPVVACCEFGRDSVYNFI